MVAHTSYGVVKMGVFPLEDVVGKGPGVPFPEDAESHLEHYRRVLETGEPVRFEWEQRRPDGLHWFSVTLSPIVDTKGQVVGLTGIGRDITERVQAEETLKEYSERLEEMVKKRTAELRRANELLQQEIVERERTEEARKAAERELEEQRVLSVHSDRLRSLGQMAAGIAHELNQPLAGIRGLSEHLLIAADRGWKLTEERIRGKLRLIVEQADRMTHIIEHVRMFAREAGKPDMQPVRVNEVVRAAMNMLGAQFRSRGPELACELTEDVPVVWANPFSLEEVVLNLMINARDAVEERLQAGLHTSPPRVLLRTLGNRDGPGGHVTIEVIDWGAGPTRGRSRACPSSEGP
jgi:C4-dicarboxylate-specific signal transduction histidine kinase